MTDLEELERAVRVDPRSAAARLALGRAYGQAGRWADAERELAAASTLLAPPTPPTEAPTAVDVPIAIEDATDPTAEFDAPSDTAPGIPAIEPTSLDDYLNRVLDASPAGPDVGAIVAGEPGPSWGRRLRHPFIVMWLVLGTVAAGAGVWAFLEARERAADVMAHLERAHAALAAGGVADLTAAAGEATKALERDPDSLEALSALAEARALSLYVYGEGQVAEVSTTVVAARQRVRASTDDAPIARRDLALAEAALALGALARGVDVRGDLATLRIVLDHELERRGDDAMAAWLDGAVSAAAGDRTHARAVLATAADRLHAASAALGELDLDDQNFADAAARLQPSPLPVAAAEGGLAAAMAQLAAPASQPVPTGRALSWSQLAHFYAAHDDDALVAAAASGLGEPRFLSWLALAQIDSGHLGDARTTRARLHTPSATAVTALVDAELALAAARPDEALSALDTLGPVSAPRVRFLRGRALTDAGRASDAGATLAAARAIDPAGARILEGEAWLASGDLDRAAAAFSAPKGPLAYRAQTRLAEIALTRGKSADATDAARAAIALAPMSPRAHAALGRALVATGDTVNGGSELQQAIDAGHATVNDELAYAQAAIALGHPDLAAAALRRALAAGAPGAAIAPLAERIDPKLAVELGVSAAVPAPTAPPPPKHHHQGKPHPPGVPL